jgi:hypothetical protein
MLVAGHFQNSRFTVHRFTARIAALILVAVWLAFGPAARTAEADAGAGAAARRTVLTPPAEAVTLNP